MQQRLQLATSLVHDPQVIVLDEPFSGLDPVAVASLSVTLRQRARAGCTLLFSSHQLDLSRTSARRSSGRPRTHRLSGRWRSCVPPQGAVSSDCTCSLVTGAG